MQSVRRDVESTEPDRSPRHEGKRSEVNLESKAPPLPKLEANYMENE